MHEPFSSNRRLALFGLAALTAATQLPVAQAQAWPARPITIIVNFPPGGAADVIARIVARPLQDAIGQPVVVENRAGAGGNIGGQAVARAVPDGYTLLMSSGGMVSVNPHVYRQMAFDPIKDLVPVASAARILVFLVVRPDLPPKNLQEFVAYLRANPGRLTFGSPGVGSSPHLAAEMMKSQLDVFAVHVPYRGAAPALTDLLAGQLDFKFDPGIGLQHVKAGRLKLLAVGSPKRSPLFPDVPTLDEAGLKGFDADTIFGFYAPAGTPPEIVARLNTEINRIVSSTEMRERVQALGGEIAPMTPAQFQAKMREDFDRFGRIIRARKIVAE